MVQPALIAAPIGAAAAVVVATRAVLGGRQSKEEVRRGVVDDNEVSFACERVCASDRLMSRLGGLGKVRHDSCSSRVRNASAEARTVAYRQSCVLDDARELFKSIARRARELNVRYKSTHVVHGRLMDCDAYRRKCHTRV
jgi:hypothetical protein